MTEAVTVLIVEDDQLIQGMVEEALSDGGFKSMITGLGEEAVALLRANESIYRAIVTDINLLGTIDGWEVARCAREIDPALPVIYMTGTHGEDWPSRGLPNSVLLTKPFAPAQLVTAISNLLNAASPPIPAGSLRPLRWSMPTRSPEESRRDEAAGQSATKVGS